jgi:HK97 family phage prohead protease
MNTIVTTFLDSPDLVASVESRTIEGQAVPYNDPGKPASTLGGKGIVFLHGSLDRSLTARADKVRLLVQHDSAHPVGRLVEWHNTDEGLSTRWRVAATPAGDLALVEASERVRDGLSVGVEILDYEDRHGYINVIEAKLLEVSLVSLPAYDRARVHRVAASLPTLGRDPRSLRLSLLVKGSSLV